MKCSLCDSDNTKIIYRGVIRNGGLGQYTKESVPIFQCNDCGVIWHENQFSDMDSYYESEEYRKALEGGAEEERFYRLHDSETLDKLQYTGTDIYRGKTVADIGCGAGAFLDFLVGVADKIVAIEPSKTYREIMEKKGFSVYTYASEALKECRGKIDIVTSFDVIEHVEDPGSFIRDIFELLSVGGGKAVIGTPTDAPVMRNLIGEIYEKKLLFSTQHLWIFSEQSLRMIAEQQGFTKISFKYCQRYGIGNMLGWIRDKKPGTAVENEFITAALDGVWRGQLSDKGLADYIVMYLEK